jgi:hypothetical protein
MEDGRWCSARWRSRAVACHWRRTRSLARNAGGRCSNPCWPAWSGRPSRTDRPRADAGRRAPAAGAERLVADDERALVRQGLDDHYRRVLDQPIPALGGKSPRAAAKTPKGREKVAAWLKVLENHSAKRPAGDPIGGYDFGWMWQELGVEALRR